MNYPSRAFHPPKTCHPWHFTGIGHPWQAHPPKTCHPWHFTGIGHPWQAPARFLAAVLLLWVCLTGAFAQVATPPPRIISLMPSQTELLWEMGFGHLLVGVTDYCNYPPEVASLPHVGALALNLEKIASLQPTIIMDLDGMHKRYQLFFQQIGLNYREFSAHTLREIPEAARTMATALGDPEKGIRFAERWEKALRNLPPRPAKSPRVYVEIWDAPLQAAGPESFIGEMVEAAGGQNILTRGSIPFPVVNAEEVVKANPDIIIITYPLGNPDNVAARPGWSEVNAIRHGRIRILDQDTVVRPGPRCISTIERLIQLFSSIK